VRKSWLIINHLASHPDSTISELSSSLEISKSTAHAIVTTLCQQGVLVRDEPGPCYRLGPELIALGKGAREQAPDRVVSRELMRRFARKWGCCVSASQFVESSLEFVVVEHAVPPTPGIPITAIGLKLTLLAPAIGRAYLSGCSEERVRLLLDRWRTLTRAHVDMDAILTRIAEARADGYAVSLGEYLPEHNAVAVPLRGRIGDPVMILAMTGYPSQLSEEQVPMAGLALTALAEEIRQSRRPL